MRVYFKCDRGHRLYDAGWQGYKWSEIERGERVYVPRTYLPFSIREGRQVCEVCSAAPWRRPWIRLRIWYVRRRWHREETTR